MIYVEYEGRQMLVGATLMIVTATIQTFGVVGLEESVARVRARVTKETTRPRMLAILLSVIVYLFILHLVEMSLWAAFYLAFGDSQSVSVAMYESALGFTTMDTPELPPRWIFLGAAEGMTGVLMFAWSTGVMFNHMAWVVQARRRYLVRHPWFSAKGHQPPR
jgi:hypothetical protein